MVKLSSNKGTKMEYKNKQTKKSNKTAISK